MVPGLADLTYEDRLKRLKLPTLRYRRSRGDVIEGYKISSGKYDQEVSDLFELRNRFIQLFLVFSISIQSSLKGL
jgi:hypothetical protein